MERVTGNVRRGGVEDLFSTFLQRTGPKTFFCSSVGAGRVPTTRSKFRLSGEGVRPCIVWTVPTGPRKESFLVFKNSKFVSFEQFSFCSPFMISGRLFLTFCKPMADHNVFPRRGSTRRVVLVLGFRETYNGLPEYSHSLLPGRRYTRRFFKVLVMGLFGFSQPTFGGRGRGFCNGFQKSARNESS